jgi:DNA-binding NtrC family response regulator
MIKRVVILQDEHLVIREIERNTQRVAAHVASLAPAAVAAAVAVPVPVGVGAGAGAGPFGSPIEPESLDNSPDEAEPQDERNSSLAAVAKAAAMKAERAAIEHTLRQVHWNRRKAAQILGVSYKTLLNKIKECGISRA